MTEAMEQRLERLESKIDLLLEALPNDPNWLTYERAAEILGCSKTAAYRRIYDERAKPRGCTIRVGRGVINRQDFENWLQVAASRRPGRGELIRKAIQ